MPVLGKKARMRLASAEGIGGNNGAQLRQVRHDAVDPVARECLRHPGNCLIPRRAVRNHFRE